MTRPTQLGFSWLFVRAALAAILASLGVGCRSRGIDADRKQNTLAYLDKHIARYRQSDSEEIWRRWLTQMSLAKQLINTGNLGQASIPVEAFGRLQEGIERRLGLTVSWIEDGFQVTGCYLRCGTTVIAQRIPIEWTVDNQRWFSGTCYRDRTLEIALVSSPTSQSTNTDAINVQIPQGCSPSQIEIGLIRDDGTTTEPIPIYLTRGT